MNKMDNKKPYHVQPSGYRRAKESKEVLSSALCD